MILVARSHEFGCYIKINVRSAIDRLFSLIAQIWSSFIFFIILYYCGFKKEMNVAEMVSTISYLSFFKYRSVFIVS
jgi:ATP-binding cassette subfamily C (CFTR/MRP) protein 4